MISGIRNIKAKMNIPPSKTVTALVNVLEADAEMKAVLEANEYYFRKLAKVDAFTVEVNLAKPQGSAAIIVEGHQVFIPLADLIDLDVERQRLTDAIAQKEGFLKSVQGKLNNEGFVARAPANVVEMERKKAQDAMLEIEKLRENLESLT
jgi:valyl-tRNA synthetase